MGSLARNPYAQRDARKRSVGVFPVIIRQKLHSASSLLIRELIIRIGAKQRQNLKEGLMRFANQKEAFLNLTQCGQLELRLEKEHIQMV